MEIPPKFVQMHQYSPSHSTPISPAHMLPEVSKHRKNRLKYPQDLPQQLRRLLREKKFLTKIPSKNRFFQIHALKKNPFLDIDPKYAL